MIPGVPRAALDSPWAERVVAATLATQTAGAALLAMRGGHISAAEVGDQLKTSADLAAEGWILGYLRGLFPTDAVLSEERYEADTERGSRWEPVRKYWVLDALDGTRSYAEGFDTFCVQLAWIEDAQVRFGVVHEPVAGTTYVAVQNAGAYRIRTTGCERLTLPALDAWPESPRFIDSTPPAGAVRSVMQSHHGELVECGSIGLKICRVADGSADVFAKALRFKLWDVAPGDLILTEAGGTVGRWTGETIPYDGGQIVFRDILAASRGLFPQIARELSAQHA